MFFACHILFRIVQQNDQKAKGAGIQSEVSPPAPPPPLALVRRHSRCHCLFIVQSEILSLRIENLRLMDVSDGICSMCWHVTLIKSHVIRSLARSFTPTATF